MTKNKKKMQKENAPTLSEIIFDFLKNKTVEAFNLGEEMFFNPRQFAGFSYIGNYRYSKQIYNLKRSPYFTEKKNGNFYLTPKGRIKIIKNILKDKVKKDFRWDGIWRIVVFDIPQTNRRARDLLRYELKWLNFIEAQKSVWVTPYDVEKELSVLLKLWLQNLGGNIRIMRVEKITDDKDLKKYFKLI